MVERRRSRPRRLALGLIALIGLGGDPSLPVGSSTCRAQDPAGEEMPDLPSLDLDGEMPNGSPGAPSRGTRSKSGRKGARRPATKSSKPRDSRSKSATDSADGLKFSTDVAPLLVSSCVGCHTGNGDGLKSGELDLGSFEKLMAGTPARKVVIPGKPRESSLYLRTHGDETPKMPPGNDRRLSEEAVSRIEKWIQQGAKLDQGLDPKAPFRSYAATPEDLRKRSVAQLSEPERDKKVEEAGRARFAQANPKLKPEISPSTHFLFLGNLPKDRATRALNVLEAQLGNLSKILGEKGTDWPEKIGVYVFGDRKDLIEFIRSVERREVDANVQATSRLGIAQPYVAVFDAGSGRGDDPAAKRRTGRSKKHEEGGSASGRDRALAALLTESFATGAVKAAGNPPSWLSTGIGLHMACRLDPRGAQVRQFWRDAAAIYRNDWNRKVTEILNDGAEAKPGDVDAIGFVLVDWLMSPKLGRDFPAFVAGMRKGAVNLPDVLKSVYGSNRDEFLANSAQWVAEALSAPEE